MLETDVYISARLSYWKDIELSFPCNCGSSLDPSNEQKVVLEKYSQATFENTHLNANQGLSHEQPMGSLQNILSKIALAMPNKKKEQIVLLFLGVSLSHLPPYTACCRTCFAI